VTADRSATRFHLGLALLGGLYVGLIAAMIAADLAYTSPTHIGHALASPEIRAALRLSLISSSIAAILSVWVGVPLGYLLARVPFPGRGLVEFLLDVPIVLPPLVVGLSLLVLFQTPPGLAVQRAIPVTYHVPAVILAQFAVAAAFAARTMRVTFERTDPRAERVALTLGCTPAQAFWRVALPTAWPGVVSAFTLAWARSLGEFGPVLIFAGATRMRTEVLPTAVYLELSVGNLEAALAVSVLMIGVAAAVLAVTRAFGLRDAAAA
jgi:molybdate transport system permease protein